MIIVGETKCGFCGDPIIESENDHLYIPNYIYSENDPLEQVRDSYCHIHCLSERGLLERARILDEAYTKSPPPIQVKCVLCSQFLAGDPAMPVKERIRLLESEAIYLQSPIVLGEYQGKDVIPYTVHYSCLVKNGLLEDTIRRLRDLPDEYKAYRQWALKSIEKIGSERHN